nr:synaptogyrin-2-like [Pocillopora verrucosa]
MEGDGVERITAFLKQPQTILRLISILFSIVVFGCISAGGYDNNGVCLFNEEAGACHYGVGIGIIAFLGCIAFLALDVQFEAIENPDTKKYIVLGDLVFSALWCFLWFIGFCYLADMWRKAVTDPLRTSQINNCQAAITFSFFSIITWAGLSVTAFRKYRQLLTEFEYSRDNLSGDSYSSPYASFPTAQDQGDPYQAKPFSEPPADSFNGEDAANKFSPPPY